MTQENLTNLEPDLNAQKNSMAHTDDSIIKTDVNSDGTERAPESLASDTEQNSFRESLPEDLRDEPSLLNYKDSASLAKSFVAAQKELGSRIRIPGPDASQQVKEEFEAKLRTAGYVKDYDLNDPSIKEQLLNKLGRPETPEGYNYNIPEELAPMVDTNQLGEYQLVAHKIGLTNEQAKQLLEFDINRGMQQMKYGQDLAKETLSKEWGAAFDDRLGLAKSGLKYFESKYPEEVRNIKNGPAGNNPVVLMMAAELGKMYKESELVIGDSKHTFGTTPSEAQARINEIRNNPDHPFNNAADPAHNKAVDDMNELYKFLG